MSLTAFFRSGFLHRTSCLALCAAVATSAVTVSWTEPASAQGKGDPTKIATDYFKAGNTLFQQRNYAAALEQFQKSYATVPSPNSLLYIARCQDQLGQRKEAYQTFNRVIAEAQARVAAEPKYAPTLDTARKEREEVANKIAVITVQVRNPGPSSTLRVGSATIPRAQWGQPIPVDPGPIDVVLDTTVQRLNLRVGERKTVDIAPGGNAPPGGGTPPIRNPPPGGGGGGGYGPLLPIGIAFAGVGVIGMGMFGVAGGMSLSTYSEVEDNCPNGAGCSDDLIDRGEREQLIANIGVIIGGVGLAAGATMIIIELATGGTSTSDALGPVNIGAGPGDGGVAVGVSF